jgi:ESCRT-I complex subunit TSG101
LVAEDLAIEDTIEILAKALDCERISLDIFLKVPKNILPTPKIIVDVHFKETRKLAREQFLIKALIQKILKSAGIEFGNVNGGGGGGSTVLGGGMTRAEYYYS